MKRLICVWLAILLTAALLCACSEETIELDQTSLSMVVGDSVELSAGDAAKVNWTSSDNSIATVIGGVVSAKSVGSAVITASLENGAQAECAVTVNHKLINLLTLDVKSARVEEGKTIQLIVSFAPADATDREMTWSSSDETIAQVDENGYVTGVSEGIASITCKTSNGVEASCTITVETIQLPTAAPTQAATQAATQAPTQAAATESSRATEALSPTEENREPLGAPDAGISDRGFIFPDSSVRRLSEDEIRATLENLSGEPVSDSFAQDAINEIFARNGYIFQTPYIRAYYMAQSWYQPDFYYDGSLNDAELYNISLLSEYY